MKTKVVVFGTGNFAQCAHFYFTHDSDYEVVAFTEDRHPQSVNQLLGLPVVPFDELEQAYPPGEYGMFMAVGYRRVNLVRATIYQRCKDRGYELVSYICSKTSRWPDLRIGDNCFIFEDNTIQPFVTLGNNVVLWSGNHVGHHASISDHTFVSSHVVISGGVQVGSHCFLGVNATLRDNITIGDHCLIGAGALVMQSTEPGTVHVGQRARQLDRKSHEIDF